MAFPDGIRIKRILQRLNKYLVDARGRYDDLGRDDENTAEQSYYLGRCLGFKYALEQVKRKDVTSSWKQNILGQYRYEAAPEDIKAVHAFLKQHVKDDKDLLFYLDESVLRTENCEKFRQGFATSMERSHGLFRDTFTYMSFFELFLWSINRCRG
ncbi:MAG: hypothetical protein P9L88_01680 [Candidatus Tantalella remota]|nr:hypothetical protein [Candidatus Tantalella remota]